MKLYEIIYKPNLKLRIFATLIDYGIYVVLFYLYTSVFGTKTQDGGWEVTGSAADPIFLFWFIYFVGLETWLGATPGHDIFKLKVVKVSGEKAGFWSILKRRICDPIDILFYGIPAMICISKTEKHQRIGDLFGDTVVVKKEDIIEKDYSFK